MDWHIFWSRWFQLFLTHWRKKNLVKTKGHRMAMVLQKKFQPIELKLAGHHHKPAIQILFKKMKHLITCLHVPASFISRWAKTESELTNLIVYLKPGPHCLDLDLNDQKTTSDNGFIFKKDKWKLKYKREKKNTVNHFWK